MQLKSLFFLAPLISSVIANGASIGAAMQTIASDSTALRETVSKYNGGLLELPTVLEILGDSTKLLVDINKGTETAKSSANLTQDEALSLATQTQSLATNVNQTLTTIIAKKPVFQKVLLAPAILLNLETEKAATDKFSAAVVEKIPEALQAIAKSLIQPIDDAFNEAIAEYSF